MTTKQMFEIASDIFRNLPEVLEGISYEQAAELVDPKNLKKAFKIVLVRDDDDAEKEIQKFLEERNLEIVDDREQGNPVPIAQTRLIPFLEGNERSVDGETMLERSRERGSTGGIRQAFSDKANTNEISADEWNLVRVYTQTILRFRDSGYLFVLVLVRSAFTGGWSLFCLWLGSGFYSVYRAVGRSCE